MTTKKRTPARETDQMHLAWLREKEAGATAKQIAAKWGKSVSTVENTLSNICKADRAAHVVLNRPEHFAQGAGA